MPKHVRTLKNKRRQRILPTLIALYQKGVATAREVGTTPVDIASIEAEGLVKRVGARHTGQRGRPAVEYRLTDAGRKRAKRAVATA